jgi:hypothetical protein
MQHIYLDPMIHTYYNNCPMNYEKLVPVFHYGMLDRGFLGKHQNRVKKSLDCYLI